MTSFGGIALGEMFHRISSTIRDNGARGSGRTFRELAGAGARFAEGLISDSGVAKMGALVVDLLYGDQFARDYQSPFDVFGVRLILSSHGGFNALRASGRLYGKDLNNASSRIRHVLAVNQRYDYIKNPAQSVGGQSVEIGVNSRWRFGSKGYQVAIGFTFR